MPVGSRLRQTLKVREMSIRQFQKEMGTKGVRTGGTSYPQIHRYLNHDPEKVAEPSLDFLQVAAELLHVRIEWLVSDSGFMTEEEEERAEEVRRVQRRVLKGADLDLWEQAVKAIPELADLNAAAQMSFAETWRRFVDYRVRLHGPEAEVWTTMEDSATGWADTLAGFLMSPFQQVGRHPLVESDEFTDYALMMLQALNQAWKVPLGPMINRAEVE